MKPRGIVLLEGADSSGKTTLAKYLVDKYDARYVHSTIRRDVWRWHVGAVRMAARYVREGWLVVLDRHWLSELIYGEVFRGGPAYDVGARSLDRMLRRFGAVTVLCAPRDQETQEARWRREREGGKFEHFNRVREVMAMYADLRDGNLARPGDGYLGQLIRFGDFTARDDVEVYDLDVHGSKLPKYAKAIAERAWEMTDRVTMPQLGDNLAGRIDLGAGFMSHGNGVVFVGEKVSPRCDAWSPRLPRWPWCGHDDDPSCASWLNRAVHHLALREDQLVFTNAIPAESDDYDYLNDLHLRHPNAKFVALGNVAHAKLAALNISHETIVHPQWHRRFKRGEGPEGYAAVLRKAIS